MAEWIERKSSMGWKPGAVHAKIIGNEVVEFPFFLRNMTLEQLWTLYVKEHGSNKNKGKGRDSTLPGRDCMRQLCALLTQPMRKKDCQSYYYTRFVETADRMYVDLLQRMLNIARTGIHTSKFSMTELQLPPLTEIEEMILEAKQMVYFGKYELCEHLRTAPEDHDGCALHCVAHGLGGCPHCKCKGLSLLSIFFDFCPTRTF